MEIDPKETIIDVTPDHVLSRIAKFEQPLELGGQMVESIEEAFYVACFRQHGFPVAAESWFAGQNIEPKDINCRVKQWFQSRGKEYSAAWLFSVQKVMLAIMLELLQIEESGFAQSMRDKYEKYEEKVQFIATGSTGQRMWNSGYNPNRIFSDKPMAGFNVYGKTLKLAYRTHYHYRVPDLGSLPSVEELFTVRVLDCNTTYTKTAVSVSDSLWRRAKSIEGGSVWYQGGATMGRLCELLSKKKANLLDYGFVALTAGSNDANRSDEAREDSFRVAREYLLPLGGHPQTCLIVNTGIGIPHWSRVPEYNRWLLSKFEKYLNFDNFHFIDWSQPEGNFFLKADGSADHYYLDEDGHFTHPNDHGLRAIWRSWGRIWELRDLQLLAFKPSKKKYELPEMTDMPVLR